MKSLYETDFVLWAEHNAELLRSGRLAEADLEEIAEEIESMGKSNRRALESRIIRVLEHLLKLRLVTGPEGDHNERGWRGSILHQQSAIAALIEERPSPRAPGGEKGKSG